MKSRSPLSKNQYVVSGESSHKTTSFPLKIWTVFRSFLKTISRWFLIISRIWILSRSNIGVQYLTLLCFKRHEFVQKFQENRSRTEHFIVFLPLNTHFRKLLCGFRVCGLTALHRYLLWWYGVYFSRKKPESGTHKIDFGGNRFLFEINFPWKWVEIHFCCWQHTDLTTKQYKTLRENVKVFRDELRAFSHIQSHIYIYAFFLKFMRQK